MTSSDDTTNKDSKRTSAETGGSAEARSDAKGAPVSKGDRPDQRADERAPDRQAQSVLQSRDASQKTPESIRKQQTPEQKRRPVPAKPVERKDKGKEAPEQSVPLRLSCLAMSVLLISAAGAYSQAHPLLTFLFIWLAMLGTFLSYVFREKRPLWFGILTAAGAFMVIFALFFACYQQMNTGQINLLPALILALAGLQALHCFDLRTRADFSLAAIIGLTLLVFTSGAANDLLFIIWILGYVSCVSMLLYFESVSRSKDVGPSRPIGEGRPASLPKPARRQARAATSVVLIPVCSLPIFTILFYLLLPKSEPMITWLMENLVRPNVAVSQSDRSRGVSGVPQAPGGGGSGTGAGGTGDGGDGEGSTAKPVNPLNKPGEEQGKKGARGLGSKGEGTGDKPNFEETTDKQKDLAEPRDMAQIKKISPNTIVLRINAPRAAYCRKFAFDSYDGRGWSRSGPIDGVTFKLDTEKNTFDVGNANALLVPTECPTVEVRQMITLDEDVAGNFVPAFWVPQFIAGPTFKDVTVQVDGSLKSQDVVEQGTTYEVMSFLPIYKHAVMQKLPERTSSDFKMTLMGAPVEELRQAEQDLMKKYLQLPANLPSRVKKRAKTAAGKDANWFVKAERIAEYLRGKKYKYKTEDVYRIEAGDMVDNFLFQTCEGDCMEYASSFVVMCRANGIPARMVGGFLPGKFNKKTGFWEVKMKDSHAWAEIYLPNWSWVAFDPTPQGALPEFEKDNGWLSGLADLGLANPFGSSFQQKRSGPAGAGIGRGIVGSKLDKAIRDRKRINLKSPEQPTPPEEKKFGLEWLLEHFAKIRWWEIIIVLFVVASGLSLAYVLMRQRQASIIPLLPDNAKPSTLLFFKVVAELRKFKVVRVPTDAPMDLKVKVHVAFEEHRKEGKHVHENLEPLIGNFLEVYSLDRFGRSDRVAELESMSEQIKELVNSRPGK